MLDGEIVIAKDGALDFDALQLRLHPAASRVKLISHQFPEGCMSTSRQTRTGLVEPTTTAAQGCLCTKSEPLGTDPVLNILTGESLLAAQAMQLLIRLDRDLREARAQFNQDWFRRIMCVRPKAVSRLRRRWAKLSLPPAIPLGSLRRHYHANLAKYLYGS